MTSITLDHIESEYVRIGALIDKFKKQSLATEYVVERAVIPLAAGERLAGPVFTEDGALSHYLIKLPGEADAIEWDNACEWAQEQGGLLPTPQEQALLYANLKGEFKPESYWSDKAHEWDSACAWYQTFTYGLQNYNHKSAALRAVAVRRFIPSVI